MSRSRGWVVLVAVLVSTAWFGSTSEARAVERCGDFGRFKASNVKVKHMPCGKGRKIVKVWFYERPINIGKFHCNPSPLARGTKSYRVRCTAGRRLVRWIQQDLR